MRMPFWARGHVPRLKNGFLRHAGPLPQTGAAPRKGVHLKREICMVCLSLCNRPRHTTQSERSRLRGSGLGVSGERLDEALSGPVAAIVFNDVGTEEIASLLDGVADTEFTRENLDSLLNADHPPRTGA